MLTQFLSIFMLFFGCSKAEDSGVPIVWDYDSYVTDYSWTYCSRSEECDPNFSLIFFSLDDCIAASESAMEQRESCTLDSAAATSCLRELQSASCTAIMSASFPECDAVWTCPE